MIDIAGYRILHVLGRGAMATVYLAVQESVQREIALKVMSPTLIGNEEFGERFLREARIAANLRHPHIVQVHDVGRSAQVHYIAMEYVAGGPVMNHTAAAPVPDFALRVCREIALALDYAHQRGVIHRDIKPDNILLHEDGSAALTDFGIARANDNVRMTRVGTILGTPHYMSPEQAASRPVDGRADLYSLGVVFHELLTGKVPFDASDFFAVGLMHLSAPVPTLPDPLADLQPLIDRLLAKEPDQRFANGAELADAIAAIEARRNPAMPARSRQARPFGPPPVQTLADDEPALGEIDSLPTRRSPHQRRRAAANAGRGTARRLLGLLALGLLVAVGVAYLLRDSLRDMLPPTRNEALLEQAEEALRNGRLSGSQPSGARELYQAVLALNPDDRRARQGLAQVAAALLEDAREAFADDRLDEAARLLAQARDAGAPSLDIDALEQAMRERQNNDSRLADLIARAQTALREDRLDQGENSALALYDRALAIEPQSAVARVGQRDTLTRLLDRARAQIGAGTLEPAAAQIETVAAIDPSHLGLPEARAKLAQARQQADDALTGLLDQADALRRRGRLTQPAGDNARELYRAALTRQPDNARALEGQRAVAAALLAQAERAMADFEFDRADGLIADAAATQPALAGLREARGRLADLRQRRAGFADPAADPARQAEIRQTLDKATAAAAAGNLLYPPGDSAYDLYRRVLAIDPRNAPASQGIAALPARAQQLFEQALGSSRLSAARGYVESLETLSPTNAALPGMKRRCAAALLGYAAERLGAGELRRASEAVLQASELDPTHPDIAALRARLDQARE
ncbi:MAG: protein kinase [Lysobacteraceae bacterium]